MTTLFNKTLLISLFFFSVNLVSLPNAKSDTIDITMTGQPIKNIVDSLKLDINDIIENLDSKLDKHSFNMRTHLLIILQNLEYVADNIGDNLFDKASKQQQQFLTNTQFLLSQFKQGNLEQIEALRKLTGDMESALATLPLSKKFPIVREYSPSYIQQGEKFEVSIVGSWIGNEQPKLVFPNGECTRKVKIDRNIRFECNQSVLGDIDSNTENITAELTVYGEKSFWEEISGWFSDTSKSRKYDIGITVIPSVMGTATVSVEIETDKIETKDRSGDYNFINQHCQAGRNDCKPFERQNPNWKIDTESIVNSCESSKKSECLGVENKTEFSFKICGAIRNNGDCIKVFGKKVARDGRGHVWGKVKWKELRKYKVKENRKLETRKLKWNSDEGFTLPKNTSSFQIVVKQINGVQVIADDIGNYGWFSVSKNISSKNLIIRPQNLEEALKK